MADPTFHTLWLPVTKKDWTAAMSSLNGKTHVCPECGELCDTVVGHGGSGKPLVCVECWDKE